MIDLGAAQRRVLELDPARHARVIGAPGSGKTELVVQSFGRLIALDGWSESDAVVLAPNRLVATALRRRLERQVGRAIVGTPARTAPSLAFGILQRRAALHGVAPARLLTGTTHDEVIAATVSALAANPATVSMLSAEAMATQAFRAELRELDRVLDDFAWQPSALIALLRGEKTSREIADTRMIAQWLAALSLVQTVRDRLAVQRPGELTASAMMREACAAVRDDHELELPRVIVVDDAGELGEGAVALLAALAARGVQVWAFGDPDIATGAFHGERSRVLAGIEQAFARHRPDHRVQPRTAGHASLGAQVDPEQVVVLDTVYRHRAGIRTMVMSLAERIGMVGDARHRHAGVGVPGAEQVAPETAGDRVHIAQAATFAEQIGMVAYRLRAAHLGLHAETGVPTAQPLPWSQMAVICRSRAQVERVSALLSAAQVPTGVTAGGLVLREQQLVRELIRLLQHVLGIAPLQAPEVIEMLGGMIGGLDQLALRRLRAQLRARDGRMASAAEADELLFEAFQFAGDTPVVDSRAARRLLWLAQLVQRAETLHRAGGSCREVLWQIWHDSALAAQLQRLALESSGTRADEAHRTLDAVVALFFALQRHEEHDDQRPIAELLAELLHGVVPEDSLATGSERVVVTVSTPQGVIGREFALVCVLDVQDGSWPNVRARGSLLGVVALERWLRGDGAEPPSRRDTMHDELRLFVHAVARARNEVLIIAVSNEETHPSVFFTLARGQRIPQRLPSSRLTLRGIVAEMRRRLVSDQSDREALDTLVWLARASVPGAHPDEWYGVLPPSSHVPLVDLDGDAAATVRVSPSQVEQLETCPLDWIISRLGGSRSDYRTHIGTLLHYALEGADPGTTAAQLREVVYAQWGSLRFEASWQSQRARIETEAMTEALAQYLRDGERAGRQLLATEASFELTIGRARLRGTADRIEATPHASGGRAITVIDLKTGRRVPAKAEIAQHAQLQAYQLGVLRGAFLDAQGRTIQTSMPTVGVPDAEPDADLAGDAKLLYVHPTAVGKANISRGQHYREVLLPSFDGAAQRELERRVLEVAQIMAGARFTAHVEHHCEDQHVSGKSCALHIVPPVSYA